MIATSYLKRVRYVQDHFFSFIVGGGLADTGVGRSRSERPGDADPNA